MNAPVAVFQECFMDHYKLANITLQWDGGGFALARGRYMEQFRCTAAMSDEVIRFQSRFVPLEAYTRFPVVTENSTYALFDIKGEPMIIYHWGNRRFAFAVWPERITAEQVNECWFDPDMQNQPALNADWFFGVSGLHKALMLHEAVVLHASYINRDGQAILFTGPSGTGKSTQAELWEQYAGAEIINGDRALLRRRGSVWHAFGYPCCGSSMICQNRTLPLKAIVILEQAKENRVESLSASQKIRALVSGTEIYLWDTDEINQAFHLAEQISKEVPVIKLACRPDKNAVTVLKEYLEVI